MVCRYQNFLGSQRSGALYNFAVAQQISSTPASTVGDHQIDISKWRKSLLLDHRAFEEFTTELKEKIMQVWEQTRYYLQVAYFPIKDIELQVTSHNDGDFFRIHRDNGTIDTASRTVTFVYYFHYIPKKHKGGHLILHLANNTVQTFQPLHDSILFFDSSILHEVSEISCPSRRIEDGRFTINGWIRRF